jgi:hypothetical protein
MSLIKCVLSQIRVSGHGFYVMDDLLGIGGLFFKYTDETVASIWGDQVREEEGIRKDSLSTENERTEPDAGILEGHESHQVH